VTSAATGTPGAVPPGSALAAVNHYSPVHFKPRRKGARLQAQAQAARFTLHALILDRHGAPARVELQRLLAQLMAVALALHRVPQQLAVMALQLANLHSVAVKILQ